LRLTATEQALEIERSAACWNFDITETSIPWPIRASVTLKSDGSKLLSPVCATALDRTVTKHTRNDGFIALYAFQCEALSVRRDVS